ncbi:chorismate-binding protein, partial [Streptomyces sp. B-S-A6]
FWIDRSDRSDPGRPLLRFGTGAGITWGSDPEREWDETELKASRLLALASAVPGASKNPSPAAPAAS